MVEKGAQSDAIITLTPEVQKVLDAVAVLNEALGPKKYGYAYIHSSQIDFVEKNARYMTSEQFRNLVDNIKQDEQLASVPLSWLHNDGRYKILSGNHRIQAAMEAGLEWFFVLYTDKDLSRSEEVSIQLSHNAIEGKDDPIILKELWAEIEDVALKYYSGLDDKLLEELPDVQLDSLRNVTLDFKAISFLFLPDEAARIQEAFDNAMKLMAAKSIYLGREQEYSKLLDGLTKSGAAYDVKNSALSLMLILDIFERHQEDLAEGWENEEDAAKLKRMVPVSSVFGTDKISAGAAQTLKKALGKMKDRKLIDKDTMGLAFEILALEYLHGTGTGQQKAT